MSKKRIIGTTAAAIKDAEFQLKMRLPESFAEWLLLNNGRSLGALVIFPVYDSRDPRTTWESIVKIYEGSWPDWLDNFSDDGKDFQDYFLLRNLALVTFTALIIKPWDPAANL